MKFMNNSKNKLNTNKNKLNSKKNWFFKLMSNTTAMCVVFIIIGKGEFYLFIYLFIVRKILCPKHFHNTFITNPKW